MELEEAVRAVVKKAKLAIGHLKDPKNDHWVIYELALCAVTQMTSHDEKMFAWAKEHLHTSLDESIRGV